MATSPSLSVSRFSAAANKAWVYGCCGAANTVWAGPASTTRPFFITSRWLANAHHPQIVADEHISQPIAALQLAQQIDDLRLHRHIQRAGRLIQHQQARLQARARAMAMRWR
jgi:hypothetical protein